MAINKPRYTGVYINPDKGFYDEITIRDELNRYRNLLDCENPTFPEVYIGIMKVRVACDYDMHTRADKRKASVCKSGNDIFYRGPVIVFGCGENKNIRSLTKEEVNYISRNIDLEVIHDGDKDYTTYILKPVTKTISSEDVEIIDVAHA